MGLFLPFATPPPPFYCRKKFILLYPNPAAWGRPWDGADPKSVRGLIPARVGQTLANRELVSFVLCVDSVRSEHQFTLPTVEPTAFANQRVAPGLIAAIGRITFAVFRIKFYEPATVRLGYIHGVFFNVVHVLSSNDSACACAYWSRKYRTIRCVL